MTLRLSLVTGPAKLPVDVNTAKLHLKIDDDQTADDALVAGLVASATASAEQWLGRALITQTWQMFLDQWPSTMTGDDWWSGVRDGARSDLGLGVRAVSFPKAPLQSVTHVKTYDETDTATTYAASNYFVDTASEPGRIALRQTASAPLGTRTANRIEIQFVAGYGDDPADVPEAIRQGILRQVAHLYEHRGDGLEMAAKASGATALWMPYRMVHV